MNKSADINAKRPNAGYYAVPQGKDGKQKPARSEVRRWPRVVRAHVPVAAPVEAVARPGRIK